MKCVACKGEGREWYESSFVLGGGSCGGHFLPCTKCGSSGLASTCECMYCEGIGTVQGPPIPHWGGVHYDLINCSHCSGNGWLTK